MGRNARADKERDIASTLEDLDLAGDTDPEEAAQDAVADMTAVPQGATPGIEVPPPRGDDDEEDEEAPTSSVVVPPPADEMTPLPPPLVPAARPARFESRSGKGGGKNKMGLLTLKAPGAEKVKVYKRKETGELEFVRDYTAQDVNRFSDYESFLTRYCEPDFGAGEYELVAVNANNQESFLGTVRLIQKPRTNVESNVTSLVGQLLTRSEEINKSALDRMEKTLQEAQASRQDPLTILKGVMDMSEALEQKTGGKNNNDMLPLMVGMMQQNTQLLVAAMSKPKEEDPILKALLQKFLESGGSSSSGALPPPMPPPPPASPFAFLEKIDIAATLTGVAAVVTAFGLGKKDTSERDMLLKFLETQNADKLGMKDVIALLKNDSAGQSDTFTDTVDRIAALMNVAKNMDPGGSPQNGFMDFLTALASNRDLGAGVMRAISSKLGGAPGAPGQQSATITPEQVKKLQEYQKALATERAKLNQERALIEEEKRRLAGAHGTPTEPPPAETPSPTPPPDGQTTAATENKPSAPIELPPQTREFLAAIEGAVDETTRGRALMDFILYLHGSESFHAFGESTIKFIREGNNGKALHNLHALFQMFVSEGFLKKDTAGATLKLLNSHADAFAEMLSNVRLDSDDEVTRESLLAPPAPPA